MGGFPVSVPPENGLQISDKEIPVWRSCILGNEDEPQKVSQGVLNDLLRDLALSNYLKERAMFVLSISEREIQI